MPPRSNGVESTIVAPVRAIPGILLSLVSSSSRCGVERVIALQMNDSSPATLCTSRISGQSGDRFGKRIVRRFGRRKAANKRRQLEAKPFAVEQARNSHGENPRFRGALPGREPQAA